SSDGPVTLRPGTLVFVPADRVHACNPARDTAWSYQMLHLDAQWLREIRCEYWKDDLHNADTVHIVIEPELYASFCRLNALLFSEATPEIKETALIEFVGDCDTRQGVYVERPYPPSKVTAQIQPALERLRAAPAADTPVSELAAL